MKKLNLQKFIKFWSQFYNPRNYSDKEYYFPHILPTGEPLKSEGLKKLFEWKNGMQLSENKNRVLGLAIDRLGEINDFRKLEKISEKDINVFFKFVSENIVRSGIVWRIFILHIARPEELPMIDKFNFRAIEFLRTGDNKEINNNQNVEEYLKFKDIFNTIINKSSQNYREVDKALMAFGQFLDNPQKFLKV